MIYGANPLFLLSGIWAHYGQSHFEGFDHWSGGVGLSDHDVVFCVGWEQSTDMG